MGSTLDGRTLDGRIEPASRGANDAWQRWAMYVTSVQGQNREAADTRLLLLPTVPCRKESRSKTFS